MTFADKLLRFRGLIRLACSDALHARQYELEAEALRHELMRDYELSLLPRSMDLCLPGETVEQCRDRMRATNAEAIARICRGVEEIEAGPTSAVNEADSDAWEPARRDCPCVSCKGKGNLPCDECGVAA